MKALESRFGGFLGVQDELDHRWPDIGKTECYGSVGTVQRMTIAPGWADEIPGVTEALIASIGSAWRDAARVESMEREIVMLKKRCAVLERHASIVVPIESLAPEPYEIGKVFHAVVQMRNDEYIANFFDANIGASGDTQEEAIFNLKDMIVAAYETLSVMKEDELGPGPAHQKRVLQEFIREKR